MSCSCIQCDECEGTGSIYVSFTGEYLGKNRCDDMDEMETCDECDGSGLEELCYECREKEEEEDFKTFEQKRQWERRAEKSK